MTTIVGLLIVGTVLVFLETLLVGGVWGIAGVACYCGATYIAFDGYGITMAMVAALAALLGIALAFVFWLKVLPKTRFGKAIYLNSSQDGKAPSVDMKPLVGKTALAITDMNPSGKVEIDGTIFDARCDSSSVSTGDKLIVKSANSFELVVRKI